MRKTDQLQKDEEIKDLLLEGIHFYCLYKDYNKYEPYDRDKANFRIQQQDIITDKIFKVLKRKKYCTDNVDRIRIYVSKYQRTASYWYAQIIETFESGSNRYTAIKIPL